jgi:hypothetical protein
MSLSGQQDLAEITSPDFPGERLVACRNPVLAADRARKREDLLQATVTRKQDQIDAEAMLDGFYVLRTPVPAGELDAAAVVTAYQNLKHVETGKPQCCHSRG